MRDVGGKMGNPGGKRSSALSEENRSRFRDEFSTPELWEKIRRYGSGQSDEWPDYRMNPVTGSGWGSSAQTDFMEMLMQAFREQEDARRSGGAVAEKTKVHTDPQYEEAVRLAAGG